MREREREMEEESKKSNTWEKRIRIGIKRGSKLRHFNLYWFTVKKV